MASLLEVVERAAKDRQPAGLAFEPTPVPKASLMVSFRLLLALGGDGLVIAERRKKAAD